MAEDYGPFAKALDEARARAGTYAYITFEGDDSLRPVDSPETPYGIRPEYRFPAALLHADVDAPIGTLWYVAVSAYVTLNVRSAPTSSAPVVMHLARGVAVMVDEASATIAEVNTFLALTMIEGKPVTSPMWVAKEWLSKTRP